MAQVNLHFRYPVFRIKIIPIPKILPEYAVNAHHHIAMFVSACQQKSQSDFWYLSGNSLLCMI